MPAPENPENDLPESPPEDEDVTATSVEATSGNDFSVENLWAREPEWIVERLIERLQGLVDEIEEPHLHPD